jgi:hypothetical protein
MGFVPNENVDAVSLGEPFKDVVFVLPNAPDDIVRHADIERAVSLTGQHVDVVRLLHLGSLPLAPNRALGRE